MEEQYFSEGEGSAQGAHQPQRKDQRPLVGLFVLLIVGVSIFGLQGITRSIQYPFIRKDGSKPTPVSQLLASKEEKKAQTDAALKQIDTDKDGLNDYDEITIYRTSAFLSDSDGDGYDDKAEIRTGRNPLCNEQTQECGLNQEQFATISTSTENIPKLQKGILGPDGKPSGSLPLLSSQFQGLNSPQAVTVPGFDKPMTIDDLRNLSADEIRAYLARQGVAEKDLKNIDDTMLKQIYGQVFESTFQKVVKEQETESSSFPSTVQSQNTASTQQQIQQQQDFHPETLTPEQLRDLLRKTGKISEGDLQKIDDETLKSLAKQTYQEMKK